MFWVDVAFQHDVQQERALVGEHFADRRGDLIMSHNDIPVQPLLLNISQTASFVPEAGQSLATAHQEAIHRLAQQIVGQMELAW